MSALEWFAQFDLSELPQQYIWYFPLVETLHYLGHALVFGCILFMDVRLLGVGKSLSIATISRLTVRASAVGLVLASVTGTMLFLSNLYTFWNNPMLMLKLAMIGLALMNIAIFHFGVSRSLRDWDVEANTPLIAKISGGLSLCFWGVAVAAGRLIAYF